MSSERGRLTRERLLAAGASLIGEVGWSGVTTRLVAERAGVNQALVHYHFSSVTDLLVAACTTYTRELLGQMLRQLAQQPDADGVVDWLLAELGRYTGNDPTSLLLIEAFLASSRLPELHTRLAEMIGEFRTGLADWLRGKGYGAEAEACATVLAAAMDGLVLYRSLDPAMDVAALAGPLRRMLATGRDTTGPNMGDTRASTSPDRRLK